MTVAEIMEAVKELKVMELSELVKALEEEFGVSATPVAVAGVGGGAAAGGTWAPHAGMEGQPDRRGAQGAARPHLRTGGLVRRAGGRCAERRPWGNDGADPQRAAGSAQHGRPLSAAWKRV